ncbi:hypothetical protein PENTCL1PPCAC_8703, partial [Pristionchus entomophagus]
FQLDTSALLRQNANLNGLTGLNGLNGLNGITNQTDPLASLYTSMDMSSSLDTLNAAAFLRPGGLVSSSGSSVAQNGGVMRMSAPPSLSFDSSSNRKRPALAPLLDYPIAHKNGRFGG